MNPAHSNAKEKIFRAALELIDEEENLESITIRQIAKKADVNIALINYYYQSKENLLGQVVQVKMTSMIDQQFDRVNSEVDAAARLKNLLITTANFSFKFNKLFRIAVAGELKQGCKNSCEMVMPLLKEIFNGKSKSELRIIALQLMLPFHYIVMYPEIYSDYLNTDFFNEKQRTDKIRQMTDSILQCNQSKQN